jgi:hypothetical protein
VTLAKESRFCYRGRPASLLGKRAGNSKMTTPRHFRVFLSSPGDVSEERDYARKIIKDELPYDPFLRGQASLDIVSWDDPASPWNPFGKTWMRKRRMNSPGLSVMVL